MEQTSTFSPKVSLGARVATYLAGGLNVVLSGYFLLSVFGSHYHLKHPALTVLYCLAVLAFSVYACFKPSWVKFFILIALLVMGVIIPVYGTYPIY